MNLRYDHITILCIIFGCLVSCSTPESDGRRAADLYFKAEKASVEYRKSKYEKLIKQISANNFDTRTEVRDIIDDISNKAYEIKKEKEQKADAFYLEKSNKYILNLKENAEFQYAYQTLRNTACYNEYELSPLLEQINKLILTIIPKFPDEDKIKKDLVGRKISGVPNSYLGRDWYWITDSCEQIKQIKITSENKNANTYSCKVNLLLQADGGAYVADVQIFYELGNNDEWTMVLLESISLELLKTGKYNNCITTQRSGWIGEYQVEFFNSSDVPLVVGGLLRYEYGEWEKFCIVVDGYSSKRFGGIFCSIKDYKIEFVERP